MSAQYWHPLWHVSNLFSTCFHYDFSHSDVFTLTPESCCGWCQADLCALILHLFLYICLRVCLCVCVCVLMTFSWCFPMISHVRICFGLCAAIQDFSDTRSDKYVDLWSVSRHMFRHLFWWRMCLGRGSTAIWRRCGYHNHAVWCYSCYIWRWQHGYEHSEDC